MRNEKVMRAFLRIWNSQSMALFVSIFDFHIDNNNKKNVTASIIRSDSMLNLMFSPPHMIPFNSFKVSLRLKWESQFCRSEMKSERGSMTCSRSCSKRTTDFRELLLSHTFLPSVLFHTGKSSVK